MLILSYWELPEFFDSQVFNLIKFIGSISEINNVNKSLSLNQTPWSDGEE